MDVTVTMPLLSEPFLLLGINHNNTSAWKLVVVRNALRMWQ